MEKCAVDVGVFEHDRWRVAAKLHRHPFHVQTRERRKLFAYSSRARERDFPDRRMRDEVGADRCRVAEHEVEHTGRQASVGEGGDERGATDRRILRTLDDDRASRRKRRGNLAHRLIDRKIPRRESGDRADRLLDHHLADIWRAAGDDAAVSASAFLRQPVDDVGARRGLHPKFGERLPLLHCHGARDAFVALPQKLGGPAHDL